MKKTTLQNLANRLTKYGSLTLAFAGITDVSGQIIYTDVDPDVGGAGNGYPLDLNNDGELEFFIFQSNWGPSASNPAVRMFPVNQYYGSKTNAVLASTAGPFIYPYALNFNDLINSTNPAWNSGYSYMDLQYGNCYTNSNWCGVTDKYLGLRFEVLNGPGPGDDQTFYGWAKLDVIDSSNWLIKEYAYNSTPGESITAGQLPLGLDDSTLSKIKIVAANKQIELYNLNEATNYSLYSLTGQEVLKGTTSNRDYTIDVNTVASGLYIIELGDITSNAVLRKKVVLQ